MDSPIVAYLLVALCAFGATIQSPIKKWYQARNSRGIFLFTAMSTSVAACFFGVGALIEGVSYEIGVLPYSIVCAACYATCMFAIMPALACGPLALTALISSYSLILPTVYGLVYIEKPLYLTQVIGFGVLMVSLYLVNMTREKKAAVEELPDAVKLDAGDPDMPEQKRKIPAKWYFYVTLVFFGNGGVATTQQAQQLAFPKLYKNPFMFVALALATVFFLVLALIRERGDVKVTLRIGAVPAALCGIANGATNLIVVVMASSTVVPTFVFFPVVSAGGLLISYTISVLFFKERFSALQKIGILLGLVSLVFLNLTLVKIWR